MIPHRDPECGKNAIAANNQRQSQQQHAERNSEAHSSRDDREGAGSSKKKRAVIRFILLFFPPLSAAPSHPARLSSKAAACCRVAQRAAGAFCVSSRAMEEHPSAPSRPTKSSSGHVDCRQDCWQWEMWWPPAWCHRYSRQQIPCTKHAAFPAPPDPLSTWHN